MHFFFFSQARGGFEPVILLSHPRFTSLSYDHISVCKVIRIVAWTWRLGDIQTDSMRTVYNSQVNRMQNGSLVVHACFSSTALQFQPVISVARNLNYWKQQLYSVSGTVHINQLITSARHMPAAVVLGTN